MTHTPAMEPSTITSIESDTLRTCLASIDSMDDIDSTDRVNLTKVSQLDLLLTQLTVSISTHNFSLSPLILPTKFLSVLLTVSCRIPQINKPNFESSQDIIDPETERELQRDYTNLASLSQRSAVILRAYLNLLNNPEIPQNSKEPVYEALNSLISLFITKPVSLRGTYDRAAGKRAQSNVSDLYSITQMLQNPNKKMKHEEDASYVEEDTTIVASPSPLQDTDVDIERYLSNGTKAVDDTTLKNSLNSLSTLAASRESTPRKSPAPGGEASFKIYDEDLITSLLNPNNKSNYSLWSLLKWTFYCGGLGQNNSDSSYRLYANYKAFLEFVFDFVEFDLQHFENEKLQPYLNGTNLSPGPKQLYFRAINTHDFLLAKLFLQRTTNSMNWYDRVIEIAFYTGDPKHGGNPGPCFPKEQHLTANAHYKSEKSNHILVDSMKLRFKIIYLCYKLCLLISRQSPVDTYQETHMVVDSNMDFGVFLEVLCSKVVLLDNTVIEQFIKTSVIAAYKNSFDKYYVQFSLFSMIIILEHFADRSLNKELLEVYLRCRGSTDHLIKGVLRFLKLRTKEILKQFVDVELPQDRTRSWQIVRMILFTFCEFLTRWNDFESGDTKLVDNTVRHIKQEAPKIDDVIQKSSAIKLDTSYDFKYL